MRHRHQAAGNNKAASPREAKSPLLNAAESTSPTAAAAATNAKDSDDDIAKKVSAAIQSRKEAKNRVVEVLFRYLWYLVTFLAFITRIYKIHDPQKVVFDEVHFGKFASYYLRREYYFDVHPPLGKMLLAFVGWLVGYDGHFLFTEINEDYVENRVPYIAFRLFCAMCGALVVPVAFWTMKEMGISVAASMFVALLLIFDNALITQSKLILLDSMLMLFCVCTIYCWVKFYKQRHAPYSLQWKLWLALTGVCIALTLGVKMVGLFTMAAVGIAVLYDLWELLDVNRGLTVRQFARHFSWRALGLIFLPLFLYMSFFYAHFAVLTRSGPGDAFMSIAFQSTLSGNDITSASTAVPMGSIIKLRHRDNRAFLHSHTHKYPLRYDDGRVSSEGQQVTCYSHADKNNDFALEPVDPALFPSAVEDRGVRYLRNQDYVRLRHVFTDKYLVTHDVASPLTSTNMEVTALSPEVANKRYNETVWKIAVVNTKDTNKEKIFSRRTLLRIINVHHKVAINANKKNLPKWGFEQVEVNGDKNPVAESAVWRVDTVTHERIKDGVEVGVKDEDIPAPLTMSFMSKFLELQSLMLSHNAGLTGSHPYSSSPMSWPFLTRGISFWETKVGLRQIYLIGNPIAWWLCILVTLAFVAIWVMDRILLRRGIDDIGAPMRRWWDRSVGFIFITWLCHWVPFFLMGRQLFLHHYLPSYIFSVMMTGMVLDILGRVLLEDTTRISPRTPYYVWMKRQASSTLMLVLTGLFAACLLSFWMYAPFTYGTGFSNVDILTSRKWLPGWDFQYAKVVV